MSTKGLPKSLALKKPKPRSRTHRYTLYLTLRCNLSCDYCYISKNPARISLTTAQRAVGLIFQHAPSIDNIEIGFFGGEPLLEFPLLRDIIAHPMIRRALA